MENLIKFIAVVLSISIGQNTFSQGALSLPEMNVLFRNYDNIIEIGTGGYKKEVLLVSENLSFTQTDDKSVYHARVSSSKREATIYIVSVDKKDTLKSFKYRLRNLPAPTLFLGKVPDGKEISIIDNDSLVVKGNNVVLPTDWKFHVICYEVFWEGLDHRLLGSGSVFSTEIVAELKDLQLTLGPNESIAVKIEAKVDDDQNDNVERKISGTFYFR